MTQNQVKEKVRLYSRRTLLRKMRVFLIWLLIALWVQGSEVNLTDLALIFKQILLTKYGSEVGPVVVVADDTDPLIWAVDSEGRTQLHVAAARGHVQIVQILTGGSDCDVNKADYKGWTALHTAVLSNRTEVVRFMCTLPTIDVNKVSRTGMSALLVAAFLNETDIVHLLSLVPGCDPNLANIDLWTPAHTVSWNGTLEVIKILSAMPGFDVNRAELTHGWTPLHIAVFQNRTSIAAHLVSLPECDVKLRHGGGSTALEMAEDLGLHEMVLLLSSS